MDNKEKMCIRDRYEVVGIAERLLTGYMAIHQPEIVRMPAEIFAAEFRIVDCHILHLPEGILRSDFGIAQLHILHILENVLAVAFQSVYADAVSYTHLIDVQVVTRKGTQTRYTSNISLFASNTRST